MKRFYLLAAAVSVTGGMAFADPGEEAPERDGAVLDIQLPQPAQAVPAGHSGAPSGRLPYE